jgi:hypothetical protein
MIWCWLDLKSDVHTSRDKGANNPISAVPLHSEIWQAVSKDPTSARNPGT